MRSCTSPAGRLESHQRGFWIETLVLCPGDLLSKSSNFFQKKVVGGQPPVNDRRVGGKHNTVKQADSGLGGWMFRKFQREPLKPDHVLAFCQASFRMILLWAGFFTLAPGTPSSGLLPHLQPHPGLPPLTSASTGDQGKPHGTEVVGPGERRKIQSSLKAFQRHRVYHEALSLWSTPRVDSHSLGPTSGDKSPLPIWC